MATSKRAKSAKKAKKGTMKSKKELLATRGTPKGTKTKTTKTTKPTKDKKAKAKASNFSPRSHEFDQHVIRRLIKENPRRAGSAKAKVWSKLHKGMTVEQFVKKGGSRSVVRFYLHNGWIKLLAPSNAPTDE